MLVFYHLEAGYIIDIIKHKNSLDSDYFNTYIYMHSVELSMKNVLQPHGLILGLKTLFLLMSPSKRRQVFCKPDQSTTTSISPALEAIDDVLLTLCLPVSSADNLGKQFGPRSGPTIRRA